MLVDAVFLDAFAYDTTSSESSNSGPLGEMDLLTHEWSDLRVVRRKKLPPQS